MKKLLSLLATVSLVSTSTASIVACGNGNGDPIDENEDDNTDDQDQDQDISTIISVTDLGDINFYSLTGNDAQTQTEIINQVRTLNPNVGDAQINISNINPIDGTATISVLGFSGSLTVTFTPVTLASISFPSAPNSIIQLDDGTILVTGGTVANGSNSFLASADLSNPANPQTQTLAQGSSAFPSTPRSIFQLQDGTILVAGGTATTGALSFLASVDLSNTTNPVQMLAQGLSAFPSTPTSMIQLQDGTILVVGGTSAATSFLASVDLSNTTNPVQILAQGLFPSTPNSITQLDYGTILVAGGWAASGANSFLASVDLSNPTNPQTQTLAQGSTAFPSIPNSITQLDDGTILVVGGTTADGSNSFLTSVDLSDPANSQTQILAQGLFPSTPNSITQLQDGTILVVGGTTADGSNSFLRMI